MVRDSQNNNIIHRKIVYFSKYTNDFDFSYPRDTTYHRVIDKIILLRAC